MRHGFSKQLSSTGKNGGRIATLTWESSRLWASTWVVLQLVWRICRTGVWREDRGA